MNIATESDSENLLYCELCDFVQFATYADFQIHHLSHIRQPLVRLVKINPNLNAKLQSRSYKVNTGVARRSQQFEYVPPLKISVVNQQGLKQFQVVNNQDSLISRSTSNQEYSLSHSFCESSEEESDKRDSIDANCGPSEVEGKNLLERFGANISVSRKVKHSKEIQNQSILENSGEIVDNVKKETESSHINVDLKNENLLERLSGIGGISISTKSKSTTNGNGESHLPSGISVSTKQKSIDLNQLKKFKDNENEKKIIDRSKLLERLSGSGLISIAPKTCKGDTEKSEEKDIANKIKIKEPSKIEVGDLLEGLGCKNSVTITRSKSEDSNDSVDSRKSGNSEMHQVKLSDDEKVRVLNENSSESSEQKRFIRVKNSSFSKKRLEKQNSPNGSSTDDRSETQEEPKDVDSNVPKETGIDILERLTENLNNTVGGKKSAVVEKSEDSNSKTMEEPLLSPNLDGDEQRPELTGSHSECNNSKTENENRFNSETNSQEEEQPCTLLLTPPSSSGQDGENSNYSSISSHPNDTFTESNNATETNNSEVNENLVSFSSLTSTLTNEDQTQEQTEQQNPFWSDIRKNSSSSDQSQQDPLMTPENSVPNGDTLTPNFLHNFLNDHPPPNNIPPENSEFMSLDRLAQTQHQQSPFDLNSGDPNTPMEQLSQQVQRMPNPTPQISVISQHHMQAPQPPPLHTGVPSSPQHISPQQPNSYDSLSHMQPPMPPPLYQGFNMYSQNFSPQTPQQMPRPPMLQQRPQIQARPFQSLAAPPRQRARGPKRNVVRLPPTLEMTPPMKQPRRLDPPLQSRPQLPNTTAKLPSGITVTPPKNAVEANKVANVLASRGITVTHAVSRQTNQQPRPQPRTTGQSPILNIGSGISITSSSQNRNSGGFAVPGPRRNIPIVNHNVERPERCTTVDLTQDDEPPNLLRNRITLGRYPCKQCGKIFTSSVILENHKASHRAAAALPYKCDKCTAQYTSSAHLQQHKLNYHKMKLSAPDLAIPIVDLNHPGAREQLLKCGVYNFIPLSQLQSNNNGYFGVPIIQLDTAKEKAVSNLNSLGAGNIFVLGKLRALAPQSNH
ncbi:hypothetical protein RUM43_005367 [Polyplax serrata]|uniref:C2H2-type domain-containing protein n=1 Tax=Polyplax serrata TaxID=468196 RepID=A0AAN8RUM3_POLSC